MDGWFTLCRFSFSPSKFSSTHICNIRNCTKTSSLQLNNTQIPFTSTFKFLGITFDDKHNWKPHIEILKSKTSKDLNIIKFLSHTTWGSDLPGMPNPSSSFPSYLHVTSIKSRPPSLLPTNFLSYQSPNPTPRNKDSSLSDR